MKILLRKSTLRPSNCRELISGWTDYIGVKYAYGHGIGGVLFGETSPCPPTVFRMQCPEWFKREIFLSSNCTGTLTKSDLEMYVLLLLCLLLEEVCKVKSGGHVALFSDNHLTVSWVDWLASKISIVAGQLLRALAFGLKMKGASPLTPFHIAVQQNSMMDITSRLFCSEIKCHCKTDTELFLINNKFPLPNKASWTVFHPTKKICIEIISVLRMEVTTIE